MTHTLFQKLGAEFIGTAGLLATVIGSGIMGETLAGGNVAIALLGNTIATGAILVVLIWVFGPISGAHFNPAVTIAFLVKGDISARDAAIFIVVQVLGAWVGMLVAHGMFDLALIRNRRRYGRVLDNGLRKALRLLVWLPPYSAASGRGLTP